MERLQAPINILTNYKNDLQNRIDFPLNPLRSDTIKRREEEIKDIDEAIRYLREKQLKPF